MFSYYDDFGVSPSASPEQIREAYRSLVRILHPDQQTDPVLKRAAEGQMLRINRAYAILSDPERRRLYDSELHGVHDRPVAIPIRKPIPMVARPPEVRIGSWLWAGAAVLSLGGLFWLATQATGPLAQTKPPATPKQELAALSPATPPVTQPVTKVSSAAAVPAPRSAPSGFAGSWIYPNDKALQQQSGKYPPQFIETAITERDGSIHGRYRARYEVSDSLISPYVTFEFDGKPEGGLVNLPWHGEGGSQGMVEIKLLSPEQIELTWQATEAGQLLGLDSGTAVLMRRPD